jgi:hypothetical protein
MTPEVPVYVRVNIRSGHWTPATSGPGRSAAGKYHPHPDELKEIALQCECGCTKFEIRNSGYAYHMTSMDTSAGRGTANRMSDGDTEVGEDWERDDATWQCLDCFNEVESDLDQALHVYEDIITAAPVRALKRYMDELYKPLTTEKKELLDKLKGGFINLEEKRQVEASEGPCMVCMEVPGRTACIH